MCRQFVLFTDTDCDITKQEAEELGYNLISMPYVINGKEIYPYEDYEIFNEHEFYNNLRNPNCLIPKTCGIDQNRYRNYFEPFLKDGYDILYIHFSKAMTCTFNTMQVAIEELEKIYPNNKIYTFDTKGITIISYMMAIEVAKLYKEGKSIKEILEWCNKEVDHFSQYFFADSLKFFSRSGRVGGIAALMGEIIGIKPIIYMSEEGKMESIAKARGRKNAFKKLLDYIDELGDHIEDYPIIIGHTDAPDLANEMKNMIAEKYSSGLDIRIVCTNPTAGSHCGPDGVGVCFHSKKR